MHQHNINVLYNGFEKRSGNARTMKGKSFDIIHIESRVKSNKWGDILVLDIRKTDVYAILYRGDSNPSQFLKIKRNESKPFKTCCNKLILKSCVFIIWRRAISADSWFGIAEDSNVLRASAECTTCLSSSVECITRLSSSRFRLDANWWNLSPLDYINL